MRQQQVFGSVVFGNKARVFICMSKKCRRYIVGYAISRYKLIVLIGILMKKLLSSLVVVSFAMVSGAAFAGSHAGAPMKDDKKMEEMKAACKKADPKMDDKMKAECKAMEAKK